MQNDALLLASWKNCRKEAAAMQITNVKNEFYFFFCKTTPPQANTT